MFSCFSAGSFRWASVLLWLDFNHSSPNSDFDFIKNSVLQKMWAVCITFHLLSCALSSTWSQWQNFMPESMRTNRKNRWTMCCPPCWNDLFSCQFSSFVGTPNTKKQLCQLCAKCCTAKSRAFTCIPSLTLSWHSAISRGDRTSVCLSVWSVS